MLNDQDLISVVIPVHNVERYLLPCLKSLSVQSHSNLEVILVDDGSTDSSGRICDEYAGSDDRFHVLHTGCNGPGPARNAGMEASQGEWIAFVDSDDVFHPDYLKFLLEAAHSVGTDLAACEYQELFETDTPKCGQQTISSKVITSETAVRQLLSRNVSFMVVWAKLFRKSILKGVWFKTMMVEDTEFMSRILTKVSRIAYLENKLYYYYRRKGSLSLSSIYKPAMVFAYWGITENYKKHYPDYSEMAARLCLNSIVSFRLMNNQEKESYIKQINLIQKASWKIAFSDGFFSRGRAKMWIKLHFPKACYKLVRLFQDNHFS